MTCEDKLDTLEKSVDGCTFTGKAATSFSEAIAIARYAVRLLRHRMNGDWQIEIDTFLSTGIVPPEAPHDGT